MELVLGIKFLQVIFQVREIQIIGATQSVEKKNQSNQNKYQKGSHCLALHDEKNLIPSKILLKRDVIEKCFHAKMVLIPIHFLFYSLAVWYQ